jgi:hypothetical protein
VAFSDDQVSVVLSPPASVVEAALKVTVGAGNWTMTSAESVALPPSPEQVRV